MKRILSQRARMGRCDRTAPFVNLHNTTQSCGMLASPANLPFLVQVYHSFSPKKRRFPRPTNWKKREVDIAASPSTFMALLICCSACNITAHVDDLYPASSNSSVNLVSFRISVISSFSLPPHRSFFFTKFHPPLTIHFDWVADYWLWVNSVFSFASQTRPVCSIHWVAASASVQICCHSITDNHLK